MAPAATAELFELKSVRLVLFVLGRHVITFLALCALQNDVVSRHKTSSQHSAFSYQQEPAVLLTADC
jgi:hypothetical protein